MQHQIKLSVKQKDLIDKMQNGYKLFWIGDPIFKYKLTELEITINVSKYIVEHLTNHGILKRNYENYNEILLTHFGRFIKT